MLSLFILFLPLIDISSYPFLYLFSRFLLYIKTYHKYFYHLLILIDFEFYLLNLLFYLIPLLIFYFHLLDYLFFLHIKTFLSYNLYLNYQICM